MWPPPGLRHEIRHERAPAGLGVQDLSEAVADADGLSGQEERHRPGSYAATVSDNIRAIVTAGLAKLVSW